MRSVQPLVFGSLLALSTVALGCAAESSDDGVERFDAAREIQTELGIATYALVDDDTDEDVLFVRLFDEQGNDLGDARLDEGAKRITFDLSIELGSDVRPRLVDDLVDTFVDDTFRCYTCHASWG